MVKWVGFSYGRGQSVQGPFGPGSVTGRVSGCFVVPLSEYNVAIPIIIYMYMNNLTIFKDRNSSLLSGSPPFLRPHSTLLDTEC